MYKLVFVSAALAATAAVAQAPNDSATRNTNSNDNPSEVICVSQATTGSRVNRTRVCKTRAEWAAVRAETRKAVEQVQSFKTTDDN